MSTFLSESRYLNFVKFLLLFFFYCLLYPQVVSLYLN